MLKGQLKVCMSLVISIYTSLILVNVCIETEASDRKRVNLNAILDKMSSPRGLKAYCVPGRFRMYTLPLTLHVLRQIPLGRPHHKWTALIPPLKIVQQQTRRICHQRLEPPIRTRSHRPRLRRRSPPHHTAPHAHQVPRHLRRRATP